MAVSPEPREITGRTVSSNVGSVRIVEVGIVDEDTVDEEGAAAVAALDRFSAPVREFFTSTFREPTPPQVKGWPAIANGDHTLILAPTGTGKTLSAFL
jgi:superfamily II DNA/RNA helicase